MDEAELPRNASFCAHAISSLDKLMVVPDAEHDVRFADNPLVRGPSHLRFYAGVPIVTSNGEALGTLCVAAPAARTLSPEQEHALAALARQVMARLEESERRFEAFLDNSPAVAFVKDEAGRIVYVNKLFERRFGMTADDWRGKDDFELWPEAVARTLREHDTLVLVGDETVELIESVPNSDGDVDYWLLAHLQVPTGLQRAQAARGHGCGHHGHAAL